METVSSIITYLRQEWGFRQTRRQLHHLDDRLLHDIGVRRDEIDSLAVQLRETQRREAAAAARNRRGARTNRPSLGGHGLATQH